MLPILAGLPKLNCLARVKINDGAMVPVVAAFTQLTRLEVIWRVRRIPANGDTRALAAHLSRLTRLRCLFIRASSRHPADLRRAFSGLSNLTRQTLHVVGTTGCIAPLTTGVRTCLIAAMLRPLSKLNCLELQCVLSPDDACFLARTLPASLRRLQLILGQDESTLQAQATLAGQSIQLGDHSRAAAVALAPILVRLEVLELGLLTREAWTALIPGLAACTRLRHLTLRGPGSAVPVTLPLGHVLYSLKGLTDLVLASALDVGMAAIDIPCIAQLTALQNLWIPSWRASSGVLERKSSPAAIALVRNIDELPLAGLRMLRRCCIHGLCRMRGGGTSETVFKKRLHDLQWITGQPLAEVVDLDIAFRGTPSKAWSVRSCDGF